MKIRKYISLIFFCYGLFSFPRCKEEESYGEYYQFIEKLSYTFGGEESSVSIKATSFFSNIECIMSIQNGDTIKLDFNDIDTPQTQNIIGDWYTIETLDEEDNGYPTTLNVYLRVNDTSSQRKLIIAVWGWNCSNTLTFTQTPLNK